MRHYSPSLQVKSQNFTSLLDIILRNSRRVVMCNHERVWKLHKHKNYIGNITTKITSDNIHYKQELLDCVCCISFRKTNKL
jgi:hypothetical protein